MGRIGHGVCVVKALVYEGPEKVRFQDVAKPEPRAGEHLIRVEAVGICGSDMHAYIGHDARRPPPLILGHEAAGVVEGGTMDGQRVTVNPLVSCGVCPFCKQGRENICPNRQIISMPPREGAFAQYVCMPEENLCVVPDGVSLQKAALAEPLAVCWHAVKLALRALAEGADRSALVLGGGAIGVGSALCLKAMGIDQITVSEPNQERRSV